MNRKDYRIIFEEKAKQKNRPIKKRNCLLCKKELDIRENIFCRKCINTRSVEARVNAVAQAECERKKTVRRRNVDKACLLAGVVLY